MIDLEKHIRNIPDFPKPGIQFKDITPLLASPAALDEAIKRMAEPFKNKGITKVVGVEARGFLFAPSIGFILDAGVIPVRKPGKLPYKSVSHTYELEYGTDTIEIHEDAVIPGEHVLIVDDLLATGGTVRAACNLIESIGGIVDGVAFLIELGFLNGREKLTSYPINSFLLY